MWLLKTTKYGPDGTVLVILYTLIFPCHGVRSLSIFLNFKIGAIMKKISVALAALTISTAALFSFDAIQENAIKGTVSPADKAIRAWAVSATDTLNAEVQNGSFEITDVKAGTYSVIIEAEAPYASTRKKDVVVSPDSTVTNIGEIKLQPK